MRRIAMFAGAAAVALCVSAAQSQTKVVNFAGKWIVVDSSSLGRGGRGGLGATVTIMQEPSTLTIIRVGANGEIKSVYKLDGSESKNTITMGGNSFEQTSKAMWMSDTLMVTTSRLIQGATQETVMNLYFQPSGNLVVVTVPPPRDGSPITKQIVVYRKGS